MGPVMRMSRSVAVAQLMPFSNTICRGINELKLSVKRMRDENRLTDERRSLFPNECQHLIAFLFHLH